MLEHTNDFVNMYFSNKKKETTQDPSLGRVRLDSSRSFHSTDVT